MILDFWMNECRERKICVPYCEKEPHLLSIVSLFILVERKIFLTTILGLINNGMRFGVCQDERRISPLASLGRNDNVVFCSVMPSGVRRLTDGVEASPYAFAND